MIGNPIHLANNYIGRALAENIALSPMKLQKILYFTYRDYLQKTGSPLFTERFSTWKYGPVIESVYHQLKGYHSDSIDNFAPDIDQGCKVKAYKINEDSDPILKQVINDVWEKCKRMSGIELSELTHRPGGAWYEAYQNSNYILSDEYIAKDNIDVRPT